ncbi:50S ribosomal protein L25/general stress protein Ctc [Methyloligella sp. 2.7D]|uniref:50S ribosomal protein L25/general stress protein Ctc n=1 Tax=unclassified Methyloligella TaxID=2625955 RepID=UPI00157C4B74|nr:50S ribosomal protein L25/general stress protein Ctc [Methyloligella sp. GL2]QKP77030.1 50S ribosomal protein L25/general stress protein Ctc [Methyloligella sp. GL2]
MAEAHELKAWARDNTGTGGARAVRREGRVPAILYGEKETPEPISVEYKEIWKQYNTGHFRSTVYMLDIEGKKTRVIPRDIQLDPVKDLPLHVDFLRIAEHATITLEVPVHFLNDEAAPGLKRGGVLNVVRHEVEVSCPVDAIPESFEVDLTGLEIGDSIHISAIKMPAGVEPTITDRDFTVATITGRVAEAAAEEGEEGGAEEGAEEAKESGEE